MNSSDTDIVFVSNFSTKMNETNRNIASKLPEDISYKILTYRKTDMENSFSYEEFLDLNYDDIVKFDIKDLNTEFKDANLFLAVVCERFFTNYYYGIESTLGNKNLSFDEINFLIKSFVLFIAPYIKKSKLVFSGYVDNFMSTITYYIAEQYNKRCLSFHEVSIIDNNSNFLFEGLFGKPVENLITNETPKSYNDLISFMNDYDASIDIKERAIKNKSMKKGIFGIFSPNIFDIKYIKFAIFGYKADKKILIYMNIDKPNIAKKLKANIVRVFNKVVASLFFKTFNFKHRDDIKYIYFPLQLQPEASTASRAPFYMNQLSTIENISKSLPLGYKLLVKEHPIALGMNNISFYKKIQDIPNVDFVDIYTKGTDLIDISDLMITFGGTTLFESILRGKKVLMLLEDYTYINSRMIFNVSGRTDIRKFIRKALDANFSDEEKLFEKEKMLNFFYQRGFPRFEDFEKNIAKNIIKVYKSLKN